MFANISPTRVGVPTVAVLAFATIVGTEWFPEDIQIFVTAVPQGNPVRQGGEECGTLVTIIVKHFVVR